IHTPELAVEKLDIGLKKYIDYISRIKDLRINILNQNILYMPDPKEIFKLYKYTLKITQTTAHDRYAVQQTSDKYGLPLKHLSVFIDPNQYTKIDYQQKENIIAFSPDYHPLKEKIIDKIRNSLPKYRLQEIRDLTYSEYKDLVSRAKFMITFGEGMDGYFIESTFSGSVPFAVYNNSFFPNKSFINHSTVYEDYESMYENIIKDIDKIDDALIYNKDNFFLYSKLSSIYNYDSYKKNLVDYYRGIIDYTPKYEGLINSVVIPATETLSRMSNLEDTIAHNDRIINQQAKDIRALKIDSHLLHDILSSNSWKLTQPLRSLKETVKKHLSR
ncbi:MAG: hypothetical protein ABIR91_04660, partial [Candidatus Saccharimonadales bacterium]